MQMQICLYQKALLITHIHLFIHLDEWRKFLLVLLQISARLRINSFIFPKSYTADYSTFPVLCHSLSEESMNAVPVDTNR